MTALQISSEEREQRRALDELLLAVSPPEPITDKATLEDMLAEGKTIRRRGRAFLSVPPSIRDMATIQRLMADIQAASEDSDRQLAIQFQIASFLFWVQDGDTLRTATRADMEPCWSLGALTRAILDILGRNGLETDEKNE